MVSSSKGGTKTKKKKIEGVAGNDASPNLTPRTKKTKKSKKNELEKENISVVSELGGFASCSLALRRNEKGPIRVETIKERKLKKNDTRRAENSGSRPGIRGRKEANEIGDRGTEERLSVGIRCGVHAPLSF